MKITATKKSYIWHFNDYRIGSHDGQSWTHGPAKVVISKKEFSKVAKHYGWGDTPPTTVVPDSQSNYGDDVPLGEILFDECAIERVIRA